MSVIPILTSLKMASMIGSCQMLGIEETTYLQETGPERGIGRIGNVQPQTFGELAQHVKQVFALDSLRMVHYQESDLQRSISRVAICGGSGQSFYRML